MASSSTAGSSRSTVPVPTSVGSASRPSSTAAISSVAAPSSRALAELELAWSDGGYHGFTVEGGTWGAISSAASGRDLGTRPWTTRS
jgi:hypothetical protein